MRENVASIQFLRFAAAASVVLFHSSQVVGSYFSGNAFTKFAVLGASGVHIFFVISGFIMIYTSFSTQDKPFNAKRFIAKRIIRIYPIYFVYSAVYLYFYYFFATAKSLSVTQFVGSLFLLPGYSSLIIGPGWTLSYEVYFYACFAIAMTLGLTRGLIALTLFFLAAIAFRSAVDTSQPFIHVMTSALLLEFLLGAWIGFAVVSMVRVSNGLANLLLALAVVGFVVGFFVHLPSAITWGIPSALLVAGFVFKEINDRIPWLIRKWSFLGDSSYSLYLLHIVLIDAVVMLAIHFNNSIGTYLGSSGTYGMIFICFAMTAYCVVAALISYELVERRLIRRLQGLFRREFATATSPS